MSAPSDGARADARKARAANVPPIDDMRRLPDLLHILLPCGDDMSDLDAPPCWTAAQTVLASDWLAGVIADAKAEVREQIAMEIEAKAAGSHAAFAADEDEHLTHMAERFGGEWEPTDANRHDDGCGMCGLASAARIARADS